MAGPYNKKSCPDAHISKYGVIPKCNQQDKWHLIVDLSYPKHHSVNDGIPKQLCSLTYVLLLRVAIAKILKILDTTAKILESDPNTLLAKVDIKHAFHLLPIHSADRHLLTMDWNQSIYIDTCLPFELKSALSCLIFWLTFSLGSPHNEV